MTLNQLTLADVISNVIEELAMMSAEPVKEIEDFNPTLHGWIDFTGPVSGRLSIRCRESLAQMLASNLLGVAPENLETQAVAWDSLAELLNIICGNLVSTLYDSEKVFSLNPPQVDLINPSGTDDNMSMTVNTSEEDVQKALIMMDSEPTEFCLAIFKTEN